MDLFILLGTLFLCFGIGMPISYALGFGALVGALVDRHSAGSGDAENLRRREQGGDADDSVLRAGRRHHGRRRHGAAAGGFANVIVGVVRVRGGLSAVNILATTFLQRHLRLVGRRHLGDRLGDDPADGEGRLSARLRHQRHHQRLGAGDPGAAEPQRGDLFAGDRRHHFDHQPVHGRRGAGAAARLSLDRALHLHRLSRRPSDRRRRCRCARRCASPSTRCGA